MQTKSLLTQIRKHEFPKFKFAIIWAQYLQLLLIEWNPKTCVKSPTTGAADKDRGETPERPRLRPIRGPRPVISLLSQLVFNQSRFAYRPLSLGEKQKTGKRWGGWWKILWQTKGTEIHDHRRLICIVSIIMQTAMKANNLRNIFGKQWAAGKKNRNKIIEIKHKQVRALEMLSSLGEKWKVAVLYVHNYCGVYFTL